MAGSIKAQERAIITLSSGIASLTNNSAGIANGTADVDLRSSGNFPDDLQIIFEWIVQWATVTGIAANTVVGDLYLVPSLDGTNFPDIDTTSGSSALPLAAYAGSFVATKAPTANTNARFTTAPVTLMPLLYRPYILNKSGQTTTANSTLKGVGAQGQYT